MEFDVKRSLQNRLDNDFLLRPFESHILNILDKIDSTGKKLTGKNNWVDSLPDFASGHEYFGLHFRDGRWIFREWAPNASEIYLKGDFSGWNREKRFALSRISQNGIWEIELPENMLNHGDHYRLEMLWPGGAGERIPAWTRRVVSASDSMSFNAEVWNPVPYEWKNISPSASHFSSLLKNESEISFPNSHSPLVDREPWGKVNGQVTENKLLKTPLLIYECHIGMAQEAPGIGTFTQFRQNILPRIKDAGYKAIQIMAVAEHPYYASFGYQVSSFFACSSRFGTPEELKALVDDAHGMGIMVFMDLVHSHAVKNEVEGLSCFDGSLWQYFHKGERGEHRAWDSRCFDYGKPEVLHFLLSNCRFWMDEYRFDGFRFDGVTSMIFKHHGLDKSFTGYEDYFDQSVDEEALVYLALANVMIHKLNPDAVTIAEDVSGMPGIGIAVDNGGFGFDYRYAMGVPDHWIKLVKDTPDEEWSMGSLWHHLTDRRHDEKSISYAESHDQAMVGDQTLIHRMIGHRIYNSMSQGMVDIVVSRGIALHKMIRLITLATAGSGYLNFMGNEFGHPEWIDFPREGNGWSYHHARRMWHLVDDPMLCYSQLAEFDKDMTELACKERLLDGSFPYLLHIDESAKIIAFMRADLVFVFNFHADISKSDYMIPASPGSYTIALDTDNGLYGGFNRQDSAVIHHTITDKIHRHHLFMYLPARSGVVLTRLKRL
ncbi:1,4-alpha-glucan-branching enzyme [Desulfamplus magnetovallimortis]|uniref:1,4-alpha-glucan branching enzyme n=1 Tax=Desulfamplus magnetovallimortis TaxID=1246637 RepID=A0A1W1HAN4_9BACT|nr:alpha-amylase family glycosyl hydrolase [Desulfamplus magnetovallimortis]SLM29506.1 1,4-alpha-glucan-branching enzyme [Desulfamplus magnetovallimortis]